MLNIDEVGCGCVVFLGVIALKAWALIYLIQVAYGVFQTGQIIGFWQAVWCVILIAFVFPLRRSMED